MSTNLRLASEYSSLRVNAPPGIYLTLCLDTPQTQWDGILCTRNGPYKGATFAFSMVFQGYPEMAPTVTFKSNVWHPFVHETGKFELSLGFPTWTREHNSVQVLHYLQDSFESEFLNTISSDQCVNLECLETLYQFPQEFMNRAQECALASVQSNALYNTQVDRTTDLGLSGRQDMSYDEMMIGITRYCKAQGLD